MTNLKRMRTKTGITQATLSKITGVKLRSLQNYEQGQDNINQAAAITVLRLARALGCSVEDILE